MKISKRRVLFVVILLSVGAILWKVLWIRDDARPLATNLKLIVGMLTGPELRRDNNNHVPRNWVPKKDPTCANSWRLWIKIFFNESIDLPDSQNCWTSAEFNGWDDGWLFCASRQEDIPRTKRYTRIMAVVGADAPFTEFVDGRKETLADLPPDSTILLEVAESGVPWMRAADVEISELMRAADAQETLGSGISSAGRLIAFADGTVWLMDKATPVVALLPFCTIKGATEHDREHDLRQYMVREYDSADLGV